MKWEINQCHYCLVMSNRGRIKNLKVSDLNLNLCHNYNSCNASKNIITAMKGNKSTIDTMPLKNCAHPEEENRKHACSKQNKQKEGI
jgi:hypothetical protein